jgi:hypothetical protein
MTRARAGSLTPSEISKKELNRSEVVSRSGLPHSEETAERQPRTSATKSLQSFKLWPLARLGGLGYQKEADAFPSVDPLANQ